ncbi:MAG: NUDIX hydrolase [Pseudomonadota bacterium]
MSVRFRGAKLAILVGPNIVTLLRDDIPTINWPGYWDLPGGGREEKETPEACVLRELNEELGLAWAPDALHWSRAFDTQTEPVWFFVSEQPNFDPRDVVFGDEGQGWKLAPIDWFLHEGKTIPPHRDQLTQYLASCDAGRF